jgi:23S rRNA (guanosine2251-2'-O)-methyltransferase
LSDTIYGINPVAELLKIRAPQIKKIIFAREKDTKGIKPLLYLAQQKHIPIEQRRRQTLNRISGTTHHQGVVAIVTSRREVDLDEIIKTWQDSGEKLLALVLDGIQDPQNLGALIRTACASGVHGVITVKHRAAPMTGAVFKASAGAAEHTNIARVANLADALDVLKESGAWVVGTHPDSATTLYDIDGTLDLALVIGSEGKGMRPLVQKKCDFLVKIPLQGKIASLNASAAGAIALYEIVRQRLYQKGKGLTKAKF